MNTEKPFDGKLYADASHADTVHDQRPNQEEGSHQEHDQEPKQRPNQEFNKTPSSSKSPGFRSPNIRHQQILLQWGIIAVLLAVIVLLISFLGTGPDRLDPKTSYKVPITTGGSRVDLKAAWMEKMATDSNLNGKRLDSVEKVMGSLLSINQPNGQGANQASTQAINQSTGQHSGPSTGPSGHHPEKSLRDRSASTPDAFVSAGEIRQALKNTVESEQSLQDGSSLINNQSLSNQPGSNQQDPSHPGSVQPGDQPGSSPGQLGQPTGGPTVFPTPPLSPFPGNHPENHPGNNQGSFQTPYQSQSNGMSSNGTAKNSTQTSLTTNPMTSKFRSKGIQRMTLSLHNPTKSLKTNDNTIPAGTFARAVLLGGVDASTSIQASGDPRPILLRPTDTGTLPRKFKSDLCGCHALAASYGDISSERVFMRLEKLTCTERKTGEIIEIPIQGYVAGEDGRAGLRGGLW